MQDPQDEGEGNNECSCHDEEAEAWSDVTSGRVEGVVDHRGKEGAGGLHYPDTREEHSCQQRAVAQVASETVAQPAEELGVPAGTYLCDPMDYLRLNCI